MKPLVGPLFDAEWWKVCRVVVLDLHNGSGTTTEAAQLLGRQFIGVDVNPEYCRIAEARVRLTGK